MIKIKVTKGVAQRYKFFWRRFSKTKSERSYDLFVLCETETKVKERILRRMSCPCFTYSNENKQRRLVDDV